MAWSIEIAPAALLGGSKRLVAKIGSGLFTVCSPKCQHVTVGTAEIRHCGELVAPDGRKPAEIGNGASVCSHGRDYTMARYWS